MDPDCSGGDDADSNSSFANIIQCILNIMNNEDQHKQLIDNKTWKALVDKNVLSRDEADEINEGLRGLKTDTATEDKNEQEFRKWFQKSYPQMQEQLKKHIAQLHELADKADKVHRDCAIANVAANSTGIVSSILTIVGLGLSPVTAGVSLALTATGVGLGAASAVTNVSASAVDRKNMSSVADEAKALSDRINEENVVKEFLRNCPPEVVSLGHENFRRLHYIQKMALFIQWLQSKPHLADSFSRVMSSEILTAGNAFQVQKAIGVGGLALMKGARIFGVVAAGAALLFDVAGLVQNSKELHEGAKTPLAENLRKEAQKMERYLEDLSQIYERLCSS